MALNWGEGGTKLLFIALIHCFSEQKLRRLRDDDPTAFFIFKAIVEASFTVLGN